jgi:hypothetical protein
LPEVVDEQAPMKSISVAMTERGARVEIMRDSLVREAENEGLLGGHWFPPLAPAVGRNSGFQPVASRTSSEGDSQD